MLNFTDLFHWSLLSIVIVVLLHGVRHDVDLDNFVLHRRYLVEFVHEFCSASDEHFGSLGTRVVLWSKCMNDKLRCRKVVCCDLVQ